MSLTFYNILRLSRGGVIRLAKSNSELSKSIRQCLKNDGIASKEGLCRLDCGSESIFPPDPLRNTVTATFLGEDPFYGPYVLVVIRFSYYGPLQHTL